MGKKSLLTLLYSLILVIQTFSISIIFHSLKVEAQQDKPRFLITPYYGSERINAFFDHHYPTGWSQRDNFRKF